MPRPKIGQTVALIVTSLGGGGAERIMVLLANHFAKSGHKVDLVLLRREGPYLADVSDAVRIVDLGGPRVRFSMLPLWKYFRRERPAVVLSTLRQVNIMVAFALALVHVDTRLVLREASVLNPENKQGLTDKLFWSVYRWAYCRADAVVGISHAISGDIARVTGRTDVVTIHNPIDIETVQEKALEPVEHPWFDDNIPVIIGVGRLVLAKDFPTLIKAFAEVRRKREARLVILGEGLERPALEQLVKDLNLETSVWLPGFMSNPFRYVARSSVFVLSSRWEGFGNVLVEAMACGTAVVSTECPGGPSEILEDGKWGRLVPVGDHEALAKAMLDTLNDEVHPPVKDRAGVFSMDRAVESYLRLLLPELRVT